MTQPGTFIPLLTMHLPDLRAGETQRRMFVDTLLESYLPLFDVLDRMTHRGGAWRLALAPSPTLLRMLASEARIAEAREELEARRTIVQRELDRVCDDDERYELAEYYDLRLARLSRVLERRDDRPLEALKQYAKSESIELIAGPYAHAYLPALAQTPNAVRDQIRGGLDCMESLLGVRPSGFLLPEMGYDPTLAPLLVEEGILFTFVESHGLGLANPRPPAGSHLPVCSESGLFAFAVDRQAAEPVADAPGGYAEDPYYRANGNDLGFEEGGRAIGVKFYRNSGRGTQQALYNPSWAEDRCTVHAIDFLSRLRIRLDDLEKSIGRSACAVVPLEAERLGLGWHEGTAWLEEMLLRSLDNRDAMEPSTPTHTLAELDGIFVCESEASSRGSFGYHRDWINEETAWFWTHYRHSASLLKSLFRTYSDTPSDDPIMRGLNAARLALTLCASADGLAMMSIPGWEGGAMEKTVELLKIFNFLAVEVENKTLDLEKLEEIERRLDAVRADPESDGD